jgi:hypothetical protein
MPIFNDSTIERLFGVEDAENESRERLLQYFYRNKAYDAIRQPLPIRLLVGHKGSGKSAILKFSALQDDDEKVLSVWIRPNDLVKYMAHEEPDLNRMIEVWKRAITDIVFEKTIERLGLTRDEQQNSIIFNSIKGMISAARALLVEKLGSIADETAKAIAATFLKDETVRVYIDDLDRGWKARQHDINTISALLNAIRDLCGSDKRFQVRMALRTDVYFLVRTSDESTDKIERNIIHLVWNNHEILALMSKRIASFFGEQISESELLNTSQVNLSRRYLSHVIEERFAGLGKWENVPIHRVLSSLTRRRPRDLIKLFYGGAREAYRNDHSKISTSDLRATFESYSNERLQDIINEFRTELPMIQALVESMKPTSKERTTMLQYLYTNDQLTKKLDNITQNHTLKFANGATANPKSLAEFLYKIDFIVARGEDDSGHIVRRYFDQNRFLTSQFVDFGFKWEVHPAYRWELQPSSTDSIFKQLDLDSD